MKPQTKRKCPCCGRRQKRTVSKDANGNYIEKFRCVSISCKRGDYVAGAGNPV